MRINADFSQRVVVRPADVDWIASPVEGIDRRMLDRIGGEVARATSFVRYAPDSRFPAHTHGGGEEFLVLEGTFHDENGAYPAGHYVRNPVDSHHAPYTKEGCIIFVKLRQFEPGDRQRVVIDTRKAPWQPGAPGVSRLALHAFDDERVSLERWAPGTRIAAHDHIGGEEIVVIEGAFADEHGAYPAGTWIRHPHGSRHAPASESGCLLYVKAGHLPREPA